MLKCYYLPGTSQRSGEVSSLWPFQNSYIKEKNNENHHPAFSSDCGSTAAGVMWGRLREGRRGAAGVGCTGPASPGTSSSSCTSSSSSSGSSSGAGAGA